MKIKNILYRDISNYFKIILPVTGLLYILTITNGCKKDDNTDNNSNDSITYSLSDMKGTWQRHSLVTSISNNGFWIYGTLVNDEGSSNVHLILPNGTWDTIFAGANASLSSQGVLTTSDDAHAHSFLSTDKNLVVGTTVRNSSYTLIIDQKVNTGTTYSSADFQGTWHTHYLVSGGSWTGWIHATSTIDNTGHYTVGNVVKSDGNTNVSTGTFSISSGGVVTVGTVTTYNGFMSADKNLMVTNMTDGGGGGGLGIAQKVVAGTNYVISDLEGKWQMHDLIVGSENWSEHGIMTIDASGKSTISNMIKDNGGIYNNPGTSTLSISSDGIVTFGLDFHGFISADKKLIVGTRSDDAGNAYSLVIIQKMP